jgi:dienelactone hydrolase
MHELASFGYVVVSVEYPYASVLTVFPDGAQAPQNPEILPDGVSEEEYDRSAQRLVDQWVQDLSYVVGWLEQENQAGGVFSGRLDLQKVGVFGHSTGGGATVEFCARDVRCRAGLGLDTWMTPVSPAARQGGLEQPFLFLFSEMWPSAKNDRLFAELTANSKQAWRMTILGTDHYDFSDLPLLTPLAAQMGLKGPLEGQRVLQIISDYARTFFDQTLLGIPSTLLSGPNPAYPEVRWDAITR